MWQDNDAEACTSYVKDSTNKIQNNASVGVTRVSYFVTMHGIKKCKINYKSG
jgi:hypothetical protein